MLTAAENELLCRVGAGTPMGKMLRRYWIPALLSEELAAGGAPKRVRLLGEDLVAFRERDGRVGLLGENCPHRGASLVLARNEPGGLRCLYHGWKVDCTGAVHEAPAEPEEHGFRDRVRATAYAVHESGGVVWAYLGPAEAQPPPMNFPFTAFPDSHRQIIKVRAECNWAQSLEGVIDSAHTSHLHTDLLRPSADTGTRMVLGTEAMQFLRPSDDKRPRMETQDTAYGFRYAAIRRPLVDPEATRYVRVTLFVAPFYAMFPPPKDWTYLQAFVPLDDEHTMFYFMQVRHDAPIDDAWRAGQAAANGVRPGLDFDAEYRKFGTRENNWLQDRAAMARGESHTGLSGVNYQDLVMQESMGPIYDRTKEHLGTSDIPVIRMRRLMLDSVRRFVERGEPPLGLAEPVPYERLRAEERIIPLETPWHVVGAFAGEPTDAAAHR
jgi:phthalate 4,5-dioxygenase